MATNRLGDLYKLTFADGKSYIGASLLHAKPRYRSHQQAVLKGSTTPVHVAWRELGPPKLKILAKDVEGHKLWVLEKEAIVKHNTKIPYGYNERSGSHKPPGGFEKSHTVTADVRERIRAGNLGLKRTPEQIENNRQAHLGQKPTKEQNEKNRKAQLKRFANNPYSEETKEKNRSAMLGKKHSAERREINRQSQLKRFRDNPMPEETKIKIRVSSLKRLGKKHSEKSKAKMRLSALQRWENKRKTKN